MKPEVASPVVVPPPVVPRAAHGSLGLRQNAHFNAFWAGQTVSLLGDAFGAIALPLLVLKATDSVTQMALVTSVFGVGRLVGYLSVGSLVDRVDRRRLMIATDCARILALLPLSVGWWLFGPHLAFVFVSAGLLGFLVAPFALSHNAAVANLVDSDQLVEANGRLQISAAVAFLAGPALAGWVCGRFGAATAITVDMATFAVSIASLLFVRLRSVAGDAREDAPATGWTAALAGMRFLFAQPVLRAMMALGCVGAFATAATVDLFIYYLKHDAGRSDRFLGVALSLAAAGALVGGLFTAIAQRRFGLGRTALAAIAVSGVALALATMARGTTAVTALAMLFFAGETARRILWASAQQELTPDSLRGRAGAASAALLATCAPAGAATVAVAAKMFGVMPALGVTGVVLLVLAAVGLLTPLRRHRGSGRPRAA